MDLIPEDQIPGDHACEMRMLLGEIRPVRDACACSCRHRGRRHSKLPRSHRRSLQPAALAERLDRLRRLPLLLRTAVTIELRAANGLHDGRRAAGQRYQRAVSEQQVARSAGSRQQAAGSAHHASKRRGRTVERPAYVVCVIVRVLVDHHVEDKWLRSLRPHVE